MPARLEVITGPMFSGKTEALLHRINRATWGRQRVVAVKPHIDRTEEPFIISRDGNEVVVEKYPATILHEQREFGDILDARPDVVIIDEAQFFDPWIVDAVQIALHRFREHSLHLAVGGLDLDFAREPFGPMPRLLAIADSITKLYGVCMKCGTDGARFTQRLIGSTEQVQVDNKKGGYQVRCRPCHYIFNVEPAT